MIYAIDPGETQSAWVKYDEDAGIPLSFGIDSNEDMLDILSRWNSPHHSHDILVIEQIKGYGMPLGDTTINTVFWSGRFAEAYGWEFRLIPRSTVRAHLCHSSKAKDGNVRQAIIDRFGGKKEAIGTKKNPGPLYGIKADAWQALALAITAAERSPE